ncbi:hypothetical protein D3C80_1441650 [compost metagenome]
MGQIDLVTDAALDQQVVAGSILDVQRLVQIQRDAVGAAGAQIEDIDVLHLQTQGRQIQVEVFAIQLQGIDTRAAVDRQEVEGVDVDHIVTAAAMDGVAAGSSAIRQIDGDAANAEGGVFNRGNTSGIHRQRWVHHQRAGDWLAGICGGLGSADLAGWRAGLGGGVLHCSYLSMLYSGVIGRAVGAGVF